MLEIFGGELKAVAIITVSMLLLVWPMRSCVNRDTCVAKCDGAVDCLKACEEF